MSLSWLLGGLLSLPALFILGSSNKGAPYKVLGSIDVDTLESTIFAWKGTMYVLENILCGYSDHFGNWNSAFANHSYVRMRDLRTGLITTNISATIGTSFASVFIDEQFQVAWISALNKDRCEVQCGVGVLAISSTDLVTWSSVLVLPDVNTCNTQVAAVELPDARLPMHRYVMILEPFMFLLNNNADGDLTHGWFPAHGTTSPTCHAGGPSIRHENGYYYVVTGGDKVYLTRSKDLSQWDHCVVMISPTAADATAAELADFPEQKSRKGFDTMENHSELWDWNSNDGDVCCSGVSAAESGGSWLIWGASTQGASPKPPAKHGSTNAVGFVANVTLAQLLASFFPEPVSDLIV